MEKGWVHVEINQNIGTVEFGHPQSNSLPSVILQLLADKITETDKRPDVQVDFMRKL